MISSKKLKLMVKQWVRAGSIRSKRISFHDTTDGASASASSHEPTTKGHFAVYTKDGKRFLVPVKWLTCDIFSELLKLAEDEFGLPSDGPITLPCNASFMLEVFKLMERSTSKDLRDARDALCMSAANWRSPSSASDALQTMNQQQLLVC